MKYSSTKCFAFLALASIIFNVALAAGGIVINGKGAQNNQGLRNRAGYYYSGTPKSAEDVYLQAENTFASTESVTEFFSSSWSACFCDNKTSYWSLFSDCYQLAAIVILVTAVIVWIIRMAVSGKSRFGVIKMPQSGITVDFTALIKGRKSNNDVSGNNDRKELSSSQSVGNEDNEGCGEGDDGNKKMWLCDDDNVCALRDLVRVCARPAPPMRLDSMASSSSSASKRNSAAPSDFATAILKVAKAYQIEGFSLGDDGYDNIQDGDFETKMHSIIASLPSFLTTPSRVALNGECSRLGVPMGQPLTYEQAAATIKPFDLYAVRSNTPFSSAIQIIQEQSRQCTVCTHVGFFIDTTILRMPGMVDGEIYVVDAAIGGDILPNGMDSVKDVTGVSRNGVQVRSLREIMSAPEADNCIVMHASLKEEHREKLSREVGYNRTDKSKPCRFQSVFPKYIGKRYPQNPFNFLLSIDPTGRIMEELSSQVGKEYFCSELTVSVYAELELLPKSIIGMKARHYFPVDFFTSTHLGPTLFSSMHVIHHPRVKSIII